MYEIYLPSAGPDYPIGPHSSLFKEFAIRVKNIQDTCGRVRGLLLLRDPKRSFIRPWLSDICIFSM